jgi:hypothetical protein
MTQKKTDISRYAGPMVGGALVLSGAISLALGVPPIAGIAMLAVGMLITLLTLGDFSPF